MNLEQLAHEATACLLAQTPLTMMPPAERPRNFPLPVVKAKSPDGRGRLVQKYRPLAILEYVNAVLSGAVAAREAKERAKAQAKEEA